MKPESAGGIEIKRAMAGGAGRVELRVGEVSFELVRIPPGAFMMGSPLQEEGRLANELVPRRITLTRPFYLGRYEVTQTQYECIMEVNPSEFRGETLAVDQVSYSLAREFCNRLSQRIGVRAMLPTEAQWEYACRAGTTTRFYSGETRDDLDKVAWYRGNSAERVHPVGQKVPNAWGLYDMLGNVWEFCADFLPPRGVPDTDPRGTISDQQGAMRGGGWMHDAEYCRCSCRLISNDRFGGTGLRIAVNPE
jgi:formylglycine-generating enzyme required for sulfatase activity